MRQTAILIGVLIIIAIIAGFVYLQSDQSTSQNLTVIPSPSPAASITPSDLLQGGSSFADTKGVYVFLYPNDYKLDTQNNDQFVRVYKTGPTQQGQTEMYDGVIVHFETIELGDKNLSEWVDAKITQSTADGTSEVVSPKTPTLLNNYPGFEYSLRGLGTFEYKVFQKDQNSDYAVSITTLVADPQNVGFQIQVDDILSTLQLLK